MNLVIAGIHTGIGKTVCSAIITEALEYDYWKPVQAGELHATDSMFVKDHIGNYVSKIHNEAFKLQLAASPHWAAEEEGLTIHIYDLLPPPTTNGLIIETAGGVMSPLNKTNTNLDLIKKLNSPVVVVCSDYLGSINHSLLTIDILKNNRVKIMGLVFSGKEVKTTRDFITSYSGLPILFSIPFFDEVSSANLISFAHTISPVLKNAANAFK
jgi:dethiobiotin synthetase